MPLGAPFRTTSDPSLETMVRSIDSEAVLRDVFCRIMGDDYFSRDPEVRRSGLVSARDVGVEYTVEEAVRLDDIRRINLTVQIANSGVTPRMPYAEIHPKLSVEDGRYPRDFDYPRRIEEFLVMESQTLDRILTTYSLPLTHTHTPHPRTPFLSTGLHRLEAAREAKLIALFQYLGVNLSDSYASDLYPSRSSELYRASDLTTSRRITDEDLISAAGLVHTVDVIKFRE
ncbi:hypothetical protein HYFRA_00011150 [Hymenoscyphus fraxineus]|uniref:Uncharacterized protein n=1 Tax=Hymenoscyphus fraxineus TaxID=746836 RepID=A0A9N9L174_9HELO|nr:hypothetical protein HYFRA_00011150 [Hymenoscyphus fraxineus]